MGGANRIVLLKSFEATRLFGVRVARLIEPNSILALHGPLGSGKTSFVQGLALGLGIHVPIQSPTFSYVHLYEEEGRLPLYHFDLYRMRRSDDFFSMGFEEYFEKQGVCVIEWPERLGAAFPEQGISLYFSYAENERKVALSSSFAQKLIDSSGLWD